MSSCNSNFYDQLQLATESGRQYLLSAPIITEVFKGNFDLNTYAAFLNQAFHHVRHTAPLLQHAANNLTESQSWVTATLSEYIEEESGHEVWILDDIEACGFDRKTFAEGNPPMTSEVMVAYLYDYVGRVNAMGIFGMVLVLEGTSANLAPAVAEQVQTSLGLPDKAMTYLTTHGELDQEHLRFFENTMNKIVSQADQDAIIHVANRIYHLYGDIYRAIPSEADVIARAA